MTGIEMFDLGGPRRPLILRYTPLRNFSTDPATQRRLAEENAAAEAERQRRRHAAAEYMATANDDWQLIRTVVAGNQVALAVLDLHHPDPDPEGMESQGAACAECEESDGCESTKQTPWPCRTFTVIKQAAVEAGGTQ